MLSKATLMAYLCQVGFGSPPPGSPIEGAEVGVHAELLHYTRLCNHATLSHGHHSDASVVPFPSAGIGIGIGIGCRWLLAGKTCRCSRIQVVCTLFKQSVLGIFVHAEHRWKELHCACKQRRHVPMQCAPAWRLPIDCFE